MRVQLAMQHYTRVRVCFQCTVIELAYMFLILSKRYPVSRLKYNLIHDVHATYQQYRAYKL